MAKKEEFNEREKWTFIMVFAIMIFGTIFLFNYNIRLNALEKQNLMFLCAKGWIKEEKCNVEPLEIDETHWVSPIYAGERKTDNMFLNWLNGYKDECIKTENVSVVELIDSKEKCDNYCNQLYEECQNIAEDLVCEFKIENMNCFEFCATQMKNYKFYSLETQDKCVKWRLVKEVTP